MCLQRLSVRFASSRLLDFLCQGTKHLQGRVRATVPAAKRVNPCLSWVQQQTYILPAYVSLEPGELGQRSFSMAQRLDNGRERSRRVPSARIVQVMVSAAADLIRSGAEVLVASGSPQVARAAKAASSTLPTS
jgi:hypothetical protein